MNLTTIKRTQSCVRDFQFLVVQLDIDLNKRYDRVQSEYDKYNKIDSIDTVIIAYNNDEPVGCGCFKQLDEVTAEIKRMFVLLEYRGRGISKVILTELENWAVELGFTKLVLETGKGQPEAIGLYEKLNYMKIDNYGQYSDMPNSVCFEKILITEN